MITKTEGEILLVLFKDFTTWYNANNLSKIIKITSRGTLKALKNLEKNNFLTPKRFGKAIQYRINYNNLAKKTLELLLLEEAENKYKRWKEEFKDLKEPKIIILFGSILKSKDYKDIDLLLTIENKDYNTVMNLIDEKNNMMKRAIHSIFQTKEDLKDNLLKNDEVVLDALKKGVILKGEEELIEIIEDVSNVKAY